MLMPLIDFLDKEKIRYTIIIHSPAVEAEAIARLAELPPRELAKTVILKVDGALTMAVLPAPYRVDLDAVRHATRAGDVDLAAEEEFRGRFPNCETGAMPPFGNLYDMDVFVDERIARDRKIAFNAGSHHELIRMSWDDYNRLVKPRILRLSASPVYAVA